MVYAIMLVDLSRFDHMWLQQILDTLKTPFFVYHRG